MSDDSDIGALQPSAPARIVAARMPASAYRYELRRGEEVIATGHMTRELALEVGERIMINGRPGMVRSIEPVLRERELHLVVQLLPEGS